MSPEAEAANQRQRERRAVSCVHFTGFRPGGACKAGIEYESFPTPRLLPCIPAFKDAEAHLRPACPKFQALGMEAVLKEDEEHDVWFARTNTARAAIVAHFKATDRSAGGIPCPVCQSGELHYSIARSNGHVHAKCTSANCLNWME